MILQLEVLFVYQKGLDIHSNEIRYSVLRLMFNSLCIKELNREFNLIQNYFPGLFEGLLSRL